MKISFPYKNITFIGICFLLFIFATYFLGIVSEKENLMLENLSLSTDFNTLKTEPWRLISYSFLHKRIEHIVLNSVFFVFTIVCFRREISVKNTVILFVGGSLCAGGLFLIFKNVHNSNYLLGSSAGVISLFSFYTLNNYKKIKETPTALIPLMILFLILILDFLAIKSRNSGGHISHIGGVIFSVIYLIMKKLHLHHCETKNKEQDIIQKINQQKKDIIQKKINLSGYNSLSSDEKKFIKR